MTETINKWWEAGELTPIELTGNPSEGANLNLDPDQEIPKRTWAFMAQAGNVEGFKNKWLPLQRITDFAFGLFIGFVCGILVAAFINEILRSLANG